MTLGKLCILLLFFTSQLSPKRLKFEIDLKPFENMSKKDKIIYLQIKIESHQIHLETIIDKMDNEVLDNVERELLSYQIKISKSLVNFYQFYHKYLESDDNLLKLIFEISFKFHSLNAETLKLILQSRKDEISGELFKNDKIENYLLNIKQIIEKLINFKEINKNVTKIFEYPFETLKK